jgi:hypothetical protein
LTVASHAISEGRGDSMSAVKDPNEFLDFLGMTRGEFDAGLKKRKEKNAHVKRSVDPEKSAALMKALNAEMEKRKLAKNKSEQNFVHVQQALMSNLDTKVKIYTDELGAKLYLEIGPDKIAKRRSLDWVVQMVAKPLYEHGVFLKNKDLVEHIKTWSDKTIKLSQLPSSFSLFSDDVTFNRIKVNLTDGPTPTWDHFIKRCGANGKALMAFTWSLFEKDDKSQQYLFLKGTGGDGKGSYCRWLNGIFNDQLVGLSSTDKWAALCVGRRIGVFNDLNNTSVIMTSQFKQITGGDKVSIEQKYEKTFSATLDTKFILTTNRSINIINDFAERRRAILVELNKENILMENYEQKLQEEGSAFLAKCKIAYEELYDKVRNSIKCDYEFFESESASFEERYEALFHKCFIHGDKYVCSAADFHNRLVREVGGDNNKIGSFKEWLERTHGIKRVRLSEKGRPCVYKGISPRS